MASKALVAEQISGGRHLIDALDQSGFDVEAALWLYDDEPDEWELVIASKLVDRKGPAATYSKAGEVAPAIGEPIALSQLRVISPASHLIRTLDSALADHPAGEEITISGEVIGGTPISQAHIYRLPSWRKRPPDVAVTLEMYREWSVFRDAVCLYAAGMSWRGARLSGLSRDADSVFTVELPAPLLKERIIDWLVEGQTTIHLSEPPEVGIVEPGEGIAIDLVSPALGEMEPAGRSFFAGAANMYLQIRDLLPAGVAAAPTEPALQLTGFLFQRYYDLLHLPRWALDRMEAQRASAQDVDLGLHMYRVFVNNWRNQFANVVERRVESAMRGPDVRNVAFRWNQNWLPQQTIGSGYEQRIGSGYAIFEAFRTCGFELSSYAREYTALIRRMVETGLLPQSVLLPWERLEIH